MTAHVRITENPAVPVNFTVTTAEDTFAFSFPWWEKGDLHIYVDGVEIAPGLWDATGFDIQESIPVVGAYVGGEIVFTAEVSNCTVMIDRLVVFDRDSDLPMTGGFSTKALNSDLDRITAREQDIRRWLERAVTVPLGEDGIELPALADRIGQQVMWDSDGDFAALAGVSPGTVAHGAFGELLAATSTQAQAHGLLDTWPRFTPRNYGGVGNGIADDHQALTDAAAAAGAAAGAYGIGIVDLEGRTWKVVASPAIHPARVVFMNGAIDYSTVAAYSLGGRSIYVGIVGAGSVSAVLASLTRDGLVGAQDITVGADPDLDPGDLVLIGMSPPIGRTTGSHNAGATTINAAASIADFPTSGFLLLGSSEIVAYTGKSGNSFTGVRRGRRGTSAAAHSANTRIVEWNSAKWAIGRKTPGAWCDAAFVRRATYAVDGGSYVVPLTHSLQNYMATSQDAWIRKVTPLMRPGLVDVTFIGLDGPRSPGIELGFAYRYAAGCFARGVKLVNGSYANGSFDMCFGVMVDGVDIEGDAAAGYDGFYGISIENGCHWVSILGGRTLETWKIATTWNQSCSETDDFWGVPSYVQTDLTQCFNGGTPDDNNHELIEAHAPARGFYVRGAVGANGLGGVSLEGGRGIHLTGLAYDFHVNTLFRVDSATHLQDCLVESLLQGPRSLGAGTTNLNANCTDVATTIVLDSASIFFDGTGDSTDLMVRIGSEVIGLGTLDVDGMTVTNCERGLDGTTAAAHTAGDVVEPWGEQYVAPVVLDLRYADFFEGTPDTGKAYLTGAMTNSQNTVPVSELSHFAAPGSGPPLLAVIEGEDSARYDEVEVVSYTGKSAASGAGNLTGVVRGVKNTPADTHSANYLVMPFTPAIRNVCLDGAELQQSVKRAAVVSYGFVPTENFEIRNFHIAWRGEGRMNTYIGVIEAHGVTIRGGMLANFPYGWRTYGKGCTIRDVNGDLDIIETTGGALAWMEGPDAVAIGNYANRYYATVRFTATATAAIASANIGRGSATFATDGIVDDTTAATTNANAATA